MQPQGGNCQAKTTGTLSQKQVGFINRKCYVVNISIPHVINGALGHVASLLFCCVCSLSMPLHNHVDLLNSNSQYISTSLEQDVSLNSVLNWLSIGESYYLCSVGLKNRFLCIRNTAVMF